MNEKTRKMSRPESMAQPGQVVKRIIYLMAIHIHHGLPFKFSKLYFKDRFWRMVAANDDAWKLFYLLPSLKYCESMDDIGLVVPNSLQMVWCQSPPLFCSGSENAQDIMEILQLMEIPHHKFEEVMLQRISKKDVNKHSEGLVTMLEVYVDDFIAMSNDIRHSHLENCHGRC